MLYNGLGSIFFKEALQEKNSFINILFMFFTYFTYVCACVCSSVQFKHTHTADGDPLFCTCRKRHIYNYL